MRLILIPAALMLLGARDVPVPEATPAGDPVTCLRLTAIQQTMVRSDQIIDFRVGRKTYRNTLPYPCPGLGFEQRYLHETRTGDVCSHDTITVLSGNAMPGATCGLGKFQPVTLAAD